MHRGCFVLKHIAEMIIYVLTIFESYIIDGVTLLSLELIV